MWDSLWLDVRLATMAGAGGGLGVIERGALATVGERIAWVGREEDLPGPPGRLALTLHRQAGRWITPGLIDCHTHLVHGGDRTEEFERRLAGVSYEEIARAGGGILSTVRATRAADEDALLRAARARLAPLLAEGVTTVEVKSGYGLDLENEAKCLRVARRLAQVADVTVCATFLGLHAIPPEYAGRADAYTDAVAAMLPALAASRLVDAVDAFCERIAFTPEQVRRVFEAARALGLPVKLHAEQLSEGGGAALAAEFGALSADHLEFLDEAGAATMARAGTVAVLLPGAYYVLRGTRPPPVELLRRLGVRMAVATDSNPGSSPCTSLLLMLNMACTLFRLTPAEALLGVTREAARALGLADRGTLEPGRRADFVVWNIERPAELCYRFGWNPCAAVVRGGRPR